MVTEPDRRIVIIVFPGFELLDLSGPLCAFELACRVHGAPYQVRVVSPSGGSIRSCSGLALETSAPPRGRLDTLVTVGGPDVRSLASDTEVPRLIRLLARRSRRVASVCTGAFLLASSGLLDGRRATTHWRYAALLQSSYPAVAVDVDRIFVRDDEIWTSAGITAGIDLALAMIEEDCGLDLAKSVARDLVVSYRRQGGQSQFSTSLQLEPRPGRIRDSLGFARDRLAEQLPVDRLADHVGVSARQFARQFVAETGETPARAIERLRLEAALPRIEASTEPLEQIASRVGFGDLERMRRSCLRMFGQTPQALRRQHRARDAEGSSP